MSAKTNQATAPGVARTGRAETLCDAPPGAVWRVVADVTRTGEWSHECRRVSWLGAATAPAPGARFRGSNRSGWLRWRRVCEVLAADPPRGLAWRTVSTPLYPDSTEWRIVVQPAGPGTRIAESYRVVRLPPAWLDRLMARVNPSHIDRSAALEDDLRRLAALAAGSAETSQAQQGRRRKSRGRAVPIDNDVYDRLGESWWDENNPLNILHGSITPGRFAYFREVLTRRNAEARGLRALDIGCGGGFLAEEFAALGCDVAGVDPSPVSVEAARSHAAARGLDIDYRVGSGEQLPAADSTFDLVYCCDVLEHVSDLDRVVRETARVLTPGGLFLFDTVNRTLKSKVLVIKVMQHWPLTRITDAAIHDWDMFIKPAELADALARHGLHVGEIVGLASRANFPALVRAFLSAHQGRITYGELSRRLDVGQVKSTAASYMGFATKPAVTD